MRMVYLDLGKIYSDEKKNDEALAAFLKAESLDPSEPDAHYRLARSVYHAWDRSRRRTTEYAKTKDLHEQGGGFADSEDIGAGGGAATP